MLLTCVALVSSEERIAAFHVVQGKCVKDRADVALLCLWLQYTLGNSVPRAVKRLESHLNFNTGELVSSVHRWNNFSYVLFLKLGGIFSFSGYDDR